ncbi:Alpha/Beta hydrolase protein [Dactylonectria estremocensis]|uniref:Alpha/Beta hydrolase protein n=1 Tax=Dactylonectria estremocensis TaxID=1079267 RepID=A0A9P9J8A0_9HYPO|nr:Alpha/Beta hydrolase protein [Dactylonectria estremocensis]
MDLSKLTRKTLQVSRGFSYTYYTSPAQDSKPTLILFHGWPDTARLWAGLINGWLLPHGYGIVALDCLGYGGTSKPTGLSSYAWQHMTADAVEILDAEKLTTVISAGHDWGSVMCQRLYNFYPSRVSGLIMVNVAYMPPTGQFDLNAVNKVTKEAYGFGIYDVVFGDPHTWLENWTSPGGMRKFVTEGRTQPTLPYATPDHKADFMDRFCKDGGFDAPSCWYKALTFAVQNEADTLVAEEAKTVKVPVFYWGGEQDFVCRPAALQPSVDAGLLPNVKSVIREGGHWALLEKPVEFGQDVLGWLQGTFR